MFHIIPDDCIKHTTLLAVLLSNKLLLNNCKVAIKNNIPICKYKSNNVQCNNICYKYQPICFLKIN